MSTEYAKKFKKALPKKIYITDYQLYMTVYIKFLA